MPTFEGNSFLSLTQCLNIIDKVKKNKKSLAVMVEMFDL